MKELIERHEGKDGKGHAVITETYLIDGGHTETYVNGKFTATSAPQVEEEPAE